MSHDSWDLIKNNTSFNVNVFRRGLVALIFTLILNTVLGVLMFYAYISEPNRDYYATSGIVPPVQLTALSAPNMTSQALLEPDPPTENEDRVIPE